MASNLNEPSFFVFFFFGGGGMVGRDRLLMVRGVTKSSSSLTAKS